MILVAQEKKLVWIPALPYALRAALRHKLGFKIFEKRAGWKNTNFEGKILIFEVLSTNLCSQMLAALHPIHKEKHGKFPVCYE